MSSVVPFSRIEMAQRVAADIPEGWAVNLGLGIPTLVASQMPKGKEVLFHSENGILGMGPAPAEEDIDPWLVNAGKQPVTLLPGASLFNHAESFAIIRGGHLDLCVLGAFEVAANGDIANWTLSASDRVPAVGGAMDLTAGAKAIWVMMNHCSADGGPKIVERCRYPLTAPAVVKRIYTDLATLELKNGQIKVLSMAPGISMERLQELTGANITQG